MIDQLSRLPLLPPQAASSDSTSSLLFPCLSPSRSLSPTKRLFSSPPKTSKFTLAGSPGHSLGTPSNHASDRYIPFKSSTNLEAQFLEEEKAPKKAPGTHDLAD